MLLANIATATHIYRKFPELALLRRHPPPKTKMVDELQELCDQLGIDIDLSSAGALHVSIHITAYSSAVFNVSVLNQHSLKYKVLSKLFKTQRFSSSNQPKIPALQVVLFESYRKVKHLSYLVLITRFSFRFELL